MKRRLLSFLFIFSLLIAGAQTYKNEWISFSQSYYKIKIAKDGLYRIDSAALASSGIPIGTINPKNIQLFQRGVEIYAHIQGENDNVFNGGGFFFLIRIPALSMILQLFFSPGTTALQPAGSRLIQILLSILTLHHLII